MPNRAQQRLKASRPPPDHAADIFARGLFLPRAAFNNAALSAAKTEHMHQFGIAVDNDVWVVGDDDDLAPSVILSDLRFTPASI